MSTFCRKYYFSHYVVHAVFSCFISTCCAKKLTVPFMFLGSSWGGEAEANSSGKRTEGILGYSDHRQTTCGLLCSHVKDC